MRVEGVVWFRGLGLRRVEGLGRFRGSCKGWFSRFGGGLGFRVSSNVAGFCRAVRGLQFCGSAQCTVCFHRTVCLHVVP